MNIDKEKAKRFLGMMNEVQVKLEIEHNSYPESEELGEDIEDDYDAEEAWCAEECGLTMDEVQYIFDNLRDYQ
jgi:hypothetical protein